MKMFCCTICGGCCACCVENEVENYPTACPMQLTFTPEWHEINNNKNENEDSGEKE